MMQKRVGKRQETGESVDGVSKGGTIEKEAELRI